MSGHHRQRAAAARRGRPRPQRDLELRATTSRTTAARRRCRPIREANEYLASLRDQHKDKIVALAVAIPGGGDEHLRELERAVKQDDLRGVLISSSHRRAYPDDDDARPFFQLATELDIPVFMHPPSVGFGEERMREFRLASSVGRPFDSCLALARLIVRGVFEEFPKLKFVASHLGGGICEIIGRMDYAYELRDNPLILGPYGPPIYITRKPSDYLRMIYFDTVELSCARRSNARSRPSAPTV